MKALPILFLLLCVAASARGDNVVPLKDGRVLKNIWLLAIGVDDVTVWHGGREEVIKQDLLPDVERAKLAPSVEDLKERIAMAKDRDAADAANAAKPRTGGKLNTVSGKFYDNVHLSDVEPDAIVIVHSGGLARVGLEDLPLEVRQSLTAEIQGAQMTAEVLAKRAANDPGQMEWTKASRMPNALKPHEMAIVVVQQMASGVVVERISSRPDVTPGLWGYIEGVRGTSKGTYRKLTVTRTGVFKDANGKGLPKYRLGK